MAVLVALAGLGWWWTADQMRAVGIATFAAAAASGPVTGGLLRWDDAALGVVSVVWMALVAGATSRSFGG